MIASITLGGIQALGRERLCDSQGQMMWSLAFDRGHLQSPGEAAELLMGRKDVNP